MRFAMAARQHWLVFWRSWLGGSDPAEILQEAGIDPEPWVRGYLRAIWEDKGDAIEDMDLSYEMAVRELVWVLELAREQEAREREVEAMLEAIGRK